MKKNAQPTNLTLLADWKKKPSPAPELATQENQDGVDIFLPRPVWEALDKDAKRCFRKPDHHIAAILAAHFGEDVEIKKR